MLLQKEIRIIAVDFDGTLFETAFPTIIRPILPVVAALKNEQRKGSKIILWTCREGAYLDDAVKACQDVGLIFDAVNDNIPEVIEAFGCNSRKITADEYWDDKNVIWNIVDRASGFSCDNLGQYRIMSRFGEMPDNIDI